MRRRVIHVITGLPVGGSQMMLLKLLAAMDPESWEPEVISLRDAGVVGERIAALGIPVRALGMRERLTDVAALPRLVGWLRERPPHLVQTWLYHADLIGGIAGRCAGVSVIWGIRQSNLDPRGNRRSTIWVARVCARLSRRLPRRIVCCSEAALRFHAAMGYAADKMMVIPNGFDLRSFHPDPEARASVRCELGLPPSALVVGLVARFDPQKDHRTFLEAAARLHAVVPDVHFLLCGEGIESSNAALAAQIAQARIESCCHLMGRREDVPRLTAALDVASLSSFGEGFPNVIGEAMACGVPCVVTDVSECATIVGDTGRVVPAKNPEALAKAWRELIEAGRDTRVRLGVAARRRVEREFDITAIARQYLTLYKEVSDQAARSPAGPPSRGSA